MPRAARWQKRDDSPAVLTALYYGPHAGIEAMTTAALIEPKGAALMIWAAMQRGAMTVVNSLLPSCPCHSVLPV